jgi:hypothetical protein
MAGNPHGDPSAPAGNTHGGNPTAGVGETGNLEGIAAAAAAAAAASEAGNHGRPGGPWKKTKLGQGEWADGTWTNKPGLVIATIAGEASTTPPAGSTNTGFGPHKQKPSSGDREIQGGDRPDGNDNVGGYDPGGYGDQSTGLGEFGGTSGTSPGNADVTSGIDPSSEFGSAGTSPGSQGTAPGEGGGGSSSGSAGDPGGAADGNEGGGDGGPGN